MNNKNSIYISLALIILLAATGLAVWYAYLTKTSVDSARTKTFDPLVVPGSGGADLGVFNNDEITEKTFKEKTTEDSPGGEVGTENSEAGDDSTQNSEEDASTEAGDRPGQTPNSTKNLLKKGVQLFKLYEGPVAGFITYENDKKEVIVRLAERQRGNIIDIPLTTLKSERVTNSTILGLQRALFVEKGAHVILQHLDGDDSVLTLSTPVSELSEKKGNEQTGGVGSYLPVNIQSIVARDETILFSTIQEDGSLSVATTNLKGERTKRVWKSPLHGWNISWSGDGVGSILVSQKPSLGIPGYAYRVSLTKGTLEKVFGDEPSLTLLESTRGTYILKTTATADGYLSFIHAKTGKPVQLRRAAFPDKCVWSAQDYIYCGMPVDTQGMSFPDVWMQGAHIYADSIVKIDPRTGSESTVIETVKNSSDGLDATHMYSTPDGKYLLFIDKTTGTLWGLSLE